MKTNWTIERGDGEGFRVIRRDGIVVGTIEERHADELTGALRKAAAEEAPVPILLEQLRQLLRAVRDGDLISKPARDALVERGYAARARGWNVITAGGMALLDTLGVMR